MRKESISVNWRRRSPVGLAAISVDAKIGDTANILRLFTDTANAPALGTSASDAACLKALFHSQHEDRTQLRRNPKSHRPSLIQK